MKNPFEFKNPDILEPSDVIDLFVPVFGEYYNVPIPGHTFINGPRGSGKSMMFRYMLPDCQILIGDAGKPLRQPRKIKNLDYFSIYVPIKKGHINKTDIQLNQKHGESLLNEHFMIIHFSILIFKELSEIVIEESSKDELTEFYNEIFLRYLQYSGYEGEKKEAKFKSVSNIFSSIIQILKSINSEFQHGYIKKLIGTREPLPYNGPLLLYSEFLFEILSAIRKLSFMPRKPIYLLIDDADELNTIQQKILNSWVSMRTTNEVSLKISTQLKYKVFTTINGSRIDTPHDYSEININDIYTTKKNIYFDRVHEIVEKRLVKYKCKTKIPKEYFPKDSKQAKKVKEIENKYIKTKLAEGLNEKQAYDYAYRYSVPDFIKNLGGNRYAYSYAGFKELVNISSGIIREFIDFASEMYVSQYSNKRVQEISRIEPSVQNKIINDYSDKKIYSEFDKYRDEAENKNDMNKLHKLILGMGGLFSVILRSNASERKVFSIAINDEPDDELKHILDLAIQHGYLQKSLIGNKYGTGKARLFILNRTLAPHFGLDPSSFAGYKFMDSKILKKSLTDPKGFIKSLIPSIKGAEDEDQLTFFKKL